MDKLWTTLLFLVVTLPQEKSEKHDLGRFDLLKFGVCGCLGTLFPLPTRRHYRFGRSLAGLGRSLAGLGRALAGLGRASRLYFRVTRYFAPVKQFVNGVQTPVWSNKKYKWTQKSVTAAFTRLFKDPAVKMLLRKPVLCADRAENTEIMATDHAK